MKKVIKCILFLVIFCLIFYYVSKALWMPNEATAFYFKEPKDSFDVVYLGASNAFAHFNTTLAYNKYGFTTGLLSSNCQPLAIVKDLITESEKYQHPQLYVIDIARAEDNLKEMRRLYNKSNYRLFKIFKG